MARIFVVGAGVVGTAVGRAFLEAGHRVTLVDIAPDRVDELRADGLDAVGALDLRAEPASFVLLTVPTPGGPEGYDLRAVAAASAEVGRAVGAAWADRRTPGRHSLRRDVRRDVRRDGHAGHGEEPPDAHPVHTVVVRSTVPPGTTTQLVGPTLAAAGAADGPGFALAASPVFLRTGSADDDARWPWLSVVGARSRRVGERVADLLEPLGGDVRLVDSPETAELVKCAHNLYNATKISFWNEMWLVANRLGVDADEVAGLVARSAEGSLNPLYGLRGGAPFAGRSLPKDAGGFLSFARELGLPMRLLDAVLDVNRQLGERVAGEFEALAADRVVDLREPDPGYAAPGADLRSARP